MAKRDRYQVQHHSDGFASVTDTKHVGPLGEKSQVHDSTRRDATEAAKLAHQLNKRER